MVDPNERVDEEGDLLTPEQALRERALLLAYDEVVVRGGGKGHRDVLRVAEAYARFLLHGPPTHAASKQETRQ